MPFLVDLQICTQARHLFIFHTCWLIDTFDVDMLMVMNAKKKENGM